MRARLAFVVLLFGGVAAVAQSRGPASKTGLAELPPVRVEMNAPVPPVEPMQTETVLPPSACRLRLSPDVARAPSVPPRAGPGACGGEDLVRLEAIHLPDNGTMALTPPAVLRCSMAEALVGWVRAEVPSLATDLGARVTALDNFSSYECRGRNNVSGAKLSEHGMANAVDLRGLKLATGKVIDFTDNGLDRALRERVRDGLCSRFTTVLGPGSDSYHENHIHLDLIQRRNGYRICQWDVRDPQVASVPLPMPRPKIADATGLEANDGPPSVPLPPPEAAKSVRSSGVADRPARPGNKVAPPDAERADAAGNAVARTGTAAAGGGGSARAAVTDGSGNASPQASRNGPPMRNRDVGSDSAGNRLDKARSRRSGR